MIAAVRRESRYGCCCRWDRSRQEPVQRGRHGRERAGAASASHATRGRGGVHTAVAGVEELREEWRQLNGRVAEFDREFVAQARSDETVRRLATVPGIGTINATALVAAVGDARTFGRARDMAAWPRAATGHDRWPAETTWYQQAGEPLPA